MEQKACLLIHGFTGGPYELHPLASYLGQKGHRCQSVTLPGHEGDLRALRKVHRTEWIQCVEEAGKELADQHGEFDLIGFSMGGLLAAYAANRLPVRRLVLVNTAVYYVSPGRFVREAVRQFRDGNLRSLSVKQATPLRAVLQFTQLVRELKPEFPQIRIPTLVVQGEQDQIVHPYSANYIYGRLAGKKQLIWYPRSRHMICLDEEAERLFTDIERFLD
ncbi:alpha/beta hydrolase [Paenibacillus turpanensis]|uniref:alpha/beta hydrolase n=1 Tax=Paenibacillus turpanensis TaxID=2689078 RepID=UPI001FB718D7|nr:alpha/beta fold hydrolase [Paenibacillus turpanensis]